ncbi:serine/threonine-protein kinase [Actinoplanes sp. NPDC051513]|uniref:serine/threonine-protein kinase n=1 Tax=Actinoplanes sp. NPDC051513 TaxID=3363908 RepID=UPI00378826BF
MLHAGVRLGDRYRLEDRLGAGGMGEVWRAVDELLGRPVAVKAMLPSVADDPDFARRFLAEAKSMARVNHPAVASIHDYGSVQGVAYLVMELVDGESLAQRLARAGRLGAPETMRLIAQAAEGLQAVHDQGIVHRDIKPANLLIRRDGSVVITDFGIARHEDASRLTASGAILGTPSYLSPEQVMGQAATPRSDVYSLGLTAYECLAGERPFVGDNPYAVALQRLQSAPRTIGITLPAQVLMVVERALATDPAHRWPSAAALAGAARNATGARPADTSPRPADSGRAPARPSASPSSAPPSSAPPSSASPSSAPPSSASPSSAPASRPGGTPHPRRKVITVAWVAAVLIAATTAWFLTQSHRGTENGGHQGDPTVAAAGPTAPAKAAIPAGFTACGQGFCPSEPMCWGGLTAIGGNAEPPERVPCTEDHYWETFAAIAFPPGAAEVRADELIDNAVVAKACTAKLMASRSRAPKVTSAWRRSAWPIQASGSTVTLLHCLAGSTDGETKTAAF